MTAHAKGARPTIRSPTTKTANQSLCDDGRPVVSAADQAAEQRGRRDAGERGRRDGTEDPPDGREQHAVAEQRMAAVPVHVPDQEAVRAEHEGAVVLRGIVAATESDHRDDRTQRGGEQRRVTSQPPHGAMPPAGIGRRVWIDTVPQPAQPAQPARSARRGAGRSRPRTSSSSSVPADVPTPGMSPSMPSKGDNKPGQTSPGLRLRTEQAPTQAQLRHKILRAEGRARSASRP